MENKSTAFILMLVVCFFSSFQAIACGYNILYVVTETGTQEDLEEIVSLTEDSYNFDIEEVNPLHFGKGDAALSRCIPLAWSTILGCCVLCD